MAQMSQETQDKVEGWVLKTCKRVTKLAEWPKPLIKIADKIHPVASPIVTFIVGIGLLAFYFEVLMPVITFIVGTVLVLMFVGAMIYTIRHWIEQREAKETNGSTGSNPSANNACGTTGGSSPHDGSTTNGTNPYSR